MYRASQASFQSRIRCYGLWQTAESDARRVKQSYEKTRSQGRAGPVGYSLSQVVEVSDNPRPVRNFSQITVSPLGRKDGFGGETIVGKEQQCHQI